MIDRILPATVRWSHSRTDRDDIELFPQERQVVARSYARRRAEFTAVRACARDALAALGEPAAPLLPGAGGAPRWPLGVVGSMTHCVGYRAAAVASSADVATLGIDAEPQRPLPEGVLERIAGPEELRAMAALPTTDGLAWDRVLFSAKESVYKAWFPVARTWLGFRDVTAILAPDGTFAVRLHVRGPELSGRPLTSFEGSWAAGDGLVVTAVVVGRRDPAPPPRAPASV
ncbi:4'-phosphopantetheinyl transferase family protein [Streptomyces sp. NBC_00385]|uniref:4'-phosphopantetheinyl transferase family protein n=1 Tax=Streptomyces sp. NBC_00385 TaxID=2975733 RepID=UPI002DD9E35D|nr:4'-phosphopantetheinyl transferase superfamily protein [Streptomyces sp. NBC_00385]WRZ04076.1 4'-phosphopantetheinyl transferase superfamily protein [Streptomyces sp. NBC_00385]